MAIERRQISDPDEDRSNRRSGDDNGDGLSLTEMRGFLRIEQDALDDCIIEQPEVFFKIARAVALAMADRDAYKLRIEEVRAELDDQFRSAAAKAEQKITEGAIQQMIRNSPKMQDAERDFLRKKREADEFLALKEAFQDRSFMLRELNRARIARGFDEGLNNSSARQSRDRDASRAEDMRNNDRRR